MTSPESGPVRRPTIEANDLPDGLALFDPDQNVAHHLNAVASLIWELCDGRQRTEITSAVAGILELDEEQSAAYVDDCLSVFEAQSLLA